MEKGKKKEKNKLKYKYVIPEDLRDLYINGMWGGVTPRNEIHMQFFNERHPIPNWLECEINDKGIIGSIVDHEMGGDVVRIVQSSIVMDVQTAIAMRNWLDDRLKMIAEAFDKKGGEK